MQAGPVEIQVNYILAMLKYMLDLLKKKSVLIKFNL